MTVAIRLMISSQLRENVQQDRCRTEIRGTKQPGRDHWPRAFSNIWAGGGIQHGRFIGATDKQGEDVVERICGPGDFLATIYHHLGIEASTTLIRDFNGRPTPIVDHGKPIAELLG